MRVEVNEWPEVEAVILAMQAAGAPRYEIIAFDHIDDVVNMAEEAVLTELGVESLGDKSLGWGVGWKAYKRKLMWLINSVKAIDSGIVFISHENQKKMKVNGIERDVIMPSMGKSSYNIIVPLADIVGYVGMKTVTIEGSKRRTNQHFFTTMPTTDIYAKDRTRRRRPPDAAYEKLDGKYFINTFNNVQGASNGSNYQSRSEARTGQTRTQAGGRRAIA
jgi:hypothetical protein